MLGFIPLSPSFLCCDFLPCILRFKWTMHRLLFFLGAIVAFVVGGGALRIMACARLQKTSLATISKMGETAVQNWAANNCNGVFKFDALFIGCGLMAILIFVVLLVVIYLLVETCRAGCGCFYLLCCDWRDTALMQLAEQERRKSTPAPATYGYEDTYQGPGRGPRRGRGRSRSRQAPVLPDTQTETTSQ